MIFHIQYLNIKHIILNMNNNSLLFLFKLQGQRRSYGILLGFRHHAKRYPKKVI